MSEHKTSLREKAISEGRKFAVIAAYLWMLFVLLQLHRVTILREQNPLGSISYRVGFALINALILGKIILIAQALYLAKRFKMGRLYAQYFSNQQPLLFCWCVLTF